MEILNQTRLSVAYVGASPDLRPDIVVGQIVGKVLGHWDPHQQLHYDWDAELPILRERERTQWGDIAPDLHPMKAGCDVSAVGQIYSKDPRGSRVGSVDLKLGGQSRSLAVFGPRRWVQDRSGALRISEPERFGVLAMDWAHSFGGQCLDAQDRMQSSHFNPKGLGFVSCPERALNLALPLIEDPDQRIRDCQDRPMPINLAAIPADMPLSLFPDPTPIGQVLAKGQRVQLPTDFHNCAHPKFRWTQVKPGTSFALQGMDTQGGLFGALPELRFEAQIRLGDRRHTQWLEPSNIVFFPERRHLTVTYSAHFAFRWIPQEMREIKLSTRTGNSLLRSA